MVLKCYTRPHTLTKSDKMYRSIRAIRFFINIFYTKAIKESKKKKNVGDIFKFL